MHWLQVMLAAGHGLHHVTVFVLMREQLYDAKVHFLQPHTVQTNWTKGVKHMYCY